MNLIDFLRNYEVKITSKESKDEGRKHKRRMHQADFCHPRPEHTRKVQ